MLQNYIFCFLFFIACSYGQKRYTCNFEENSCTNFLLNDENNKGNWEIRRGKTYPGETGPTVDHTLGNANGSYLFVDNSKIGKGDKVRLKTIPLTENYCVDFFYYMHGFDIGGLTVYAESESGSNKIAYFFRRETQEDTWKEAIFSVVRSANLRTFRVVFEAEGGGIALDDIVLTPLKCKDTKKNAFQLCSFDEFDCGFTSETHGRLKWEWQVKNKRSSEFSVKPSKDHTLGTDKGGYWFYADSGTTVQEIQTASLYSPVYNKPEQTVNCLHFYVYMDVVKGSMFNKMFYGELRENYVQVYLNLNNSEAERQWLITKGKNTTRFREWNHVEVKAEINNSFQLQFVAGLQTPEEAILAIDDIMLIPGECHDEDPCANINCQNNGTCSFEDGKLKCSCERPYFGEQCEKDPCTDITCQNNGTCSFVEETFKCNCKKPYFGKNCENDPCRDEPCQNDGKCLIFVNGYNCLCKEGFFGENCTETDICFERTNFCLNNGTCIATGRNRFRCDCLAPYSGSRCQNDPCKDKPCQNDRKCVIFENGYNCLCKEGFFGENCTERDICYERTNLCLNNGTCITTGRNRFRCECLAPYSGSRCQNDPCTNNPCLNNGTCVFEEEGVKCMCKEPFYGEKCENETCNLKSCKHGRCEIKEGVLFCKCDKDYSGINCDVEIVTETDSNTVTILIVALTSSVFLFFCIFFIIRCAANKSTVKRFI